jgi:hypothetical protein
MNTPERVSQSIPHQNDADKLREIAALLDRWGWWEDADKARRKAEQIERKYAEEAANR